MTGQLNPKSTGQRRRNLHVPHTTQSRVHGRCDYPARLLQVALLDSSGALLFKSYVQPEALDWEETSDGTYLNTSHFKRKRYPTKEQVVQQIQPFLKGWEVVVYGLRAKWDFVIPFISHIRQKSCSKLMSDLFVGRSGFIERTGKRDFNQAIGCILFVPDYSSDTGLVDAESVAKGSRALWQYGTNPIYRDEVETLREYYLINPIVETIIQRERMPLYQQRAHVHQQLEKRICHGAKYPSTIFGATTTIERKRGYVLSAFNGVLSLLVGTVRVMAGCPDCRLTTPYSPNP